MGSRVKHRLVRTHNYLAKPRPSGYRSLHLIYSYRAALKHALDEFNVEIQIRTRRPAPVGDCRRNRWDVYRRGTEIR